MSDNDTQAAALINALAPKLAEALLPQLQKQVEEQIQGVVKKNDELLGKLAASKADDSLAKLLGAADTQQKQRLNTDGTLDFRKVGEPIKMSKADARDPQKYRQAKALAQSQGVQLEIDRG